MGLLRKLFSRGEPAPIQSTTPVQTKPATVATERASSEDASPPGPAIVNGGMGSYFEALRFSKDRTQLPYLLNTRRIHRPILDGLNRKQLAALGRYLADNSGTASYAVGLIANYSTPVGAQAASDDDNWNKENEEAFASWGRRADFTGRFDFSTLQRLACKAMDIDGDIGVAMTMKNGFPQLRFYDTFDIGSAAGTHKTDGVLYDADGVLLGYHVIEGFEPNTRERDLSRNEMILLCDADRMCGYRSYSPMRKGSNDLRDSNDIKAFEKLATKIGSALAAVIQNGFVEEDDWGDDSTPQEDGGNAPESTDKKSTKKVTLAELLGGDIPVIEGELKQLTNNRPGSNVVDFLGTLNGLFVSGLDLPPAFFLDEKLTGPNIRGVLSKAQKKFDTRKAVIASLVEFAYVRFTAWRIATGQITPVNNWWKLTFQFPSRLVIDLGDQMRNEREDVLAGQMSRQERHGNRGQDWQRQEDQITTEQDYIIESCQRIATTRKVPLELVLEARGFTGRASKDPDKSKGQQGKE